MNKLQIQPLGVFLGKLVDLIQKAKSGDNHCKKERGLKRATRNRESEKVNSRVVNDGYKTEREREREGRLSKLL